MTPFSLAGAQTATTPAEVAANAEVISVMVLNDAQVRAVVAGTEGVFSSARAGTVVAIHSTISVDTAVELAALGQAHGVHVVDAPVSGGVAGAHAGDLAVMAGGAAEAVERLRGPLSCWAGLVDHFGPAGSGTRAKVARNLLQFAALAASGEALRLAEAAGVDLLKLGEVVRHSDRVTGGPGASMLRTTAATLDPDDGFFRIFTHTRDLGEKDLQLALDLGAELGVDLPIATVVREQLGRSLGVPHREGDLV